MPNRLRRLVHSHCIPAFIVVLVAFVLAACGVALRNAQSADAPTNPAASPADSSAAPPVKPRTPPVSVDPLALAPGQTVVTLTFDDGRASQMTAAKMLSEHRLPATFFVNSGTIGTPGKLSLADLDTIASSGHEIAGHTVTHPDLARLGADELRRQICNDRTTLLGWGFAVRNFAYPFGAASPEIENVVKECGYNSARTLGELRPSRPTNDVPVELSCELCDVTETVPPTNPMYVMAPDQVTSAWTAADLEQAVSAAIGTGGWLPLTFHDLCTDDCSSLAVPEAEFGKFVDWLATKRGEGAVLVKTVGDVIGGPVQPAVAGPVVPAPTLGVNGVANPGLEQIGDGAATCWMQGGFGNNKPEFSLVPTAHSGTTASRLIMKNYVDGDAKLLPTTDLGECAPTVIPGRTYTVAAWYSATVPTSFAVQYRQASGTWGYAMTSPKFDAATQFTLASWTLPPIPQGVTGISFGLSLSQNGELLTDDYSLVDTGQSPP